MTHQLVDTAEGFASVLDALRDEPAYAVDTEFHRERTYYPKLALVQIAWRDGLALVDPLAVDIAPLAEILDGPGVAVLHACDQDLEVLDLACGTIPAHLFDTQIAAGFVGMSMPSLSSLYERVLGIRVGKGDRLTDWLARPLNDAPAALRRRRRRAPAGRLPARGGRPGGPGPAGLGPGRVRGGPSARAWRP